VTAGGFVDLVLPSLLVPEGSACSEIVAANSTESGARIRLVGRIGKPSDENYPDNTP